MAVAFPFLTAADPDGTGEGSLDPLGLAQIADVLGTDLVPAVRERMLRARFLTAMAVGTFVIEGLESDPRQRTSTPALVWEWHVVEAIVRTPDSADAKGGTWGVPGIGVTRRAIKHHDHLDARSYLATPRVFGFNGVYKRLAVQLGISDVHLAPGPMAERLVDTWARDRDTDGFRGAEPLIARWRAAIERALGQSPPATRPGWNRETWSELGMAFLPGKAGQREKKFLRSLLTARGEGRIGALPEIWDLQAGFRDDTFAEEILHDRLEAVDPSRGPLLAAIRAYEAFSRGLQDGFDLLRFVASRDDTRGCRIPAVGEKPQFRDAVYRLHQLYARTDAALGALDGPPAALQPVFASRFAAFAEPMPPKAVAWALVEHHRRVQDDKGGKRPWFDDLGDQKIHVRHDYRLGEFTPQPVKYVHAYRGRPIGDFHRDLG
jgi:hypothetical protein